MQGVASMLEAVFQNVDTLSIAYCAGPITVLATIIYVIRGANGFILCCSVSAYRSRVRYINLQNCMRIFAGMPFAHL